MMNEKERFLNELFINYHDALKKYCCVLIDSNNHYFITADECVQEAFVRAVKDYEKIKKSPNPFGWLALCCKNYYLSKKTTKYTAFNNHRHSYKFRAIRRCSGPHG